MATRTIREAEHFAVDIPLFAGRVFNDRDLMSAPNVTVVSKALARLYFPNEDPLGKQMVFAFPIPESHARSSEWSATCETCP